MYYQQQKSFKNVSFLVYKYIKKTSLYQHHDSKLHKVGTCRVFGLQFNLNFLCFLFEEIQYLDVCLLHVLSSAKKEYHFRLNSSLHHNNYHIIIKSWAFMAKQINLFFSIQNLITSITHGNNIYF